ncbi:MAG: tRNA 2-selenouridine(34) synthase MnmH [Pelovirga sp.]
MQATIDLATALNQRDQALFIDVRSPAEFADATIPGAINVPLFSNTERAEIGTLYKHQGRMVARRRGVELAAPRIPAYVDQIDAARSARTTPVIIFCWRGGMRSLAMTSFMNLAGIPARQLIGGHKAFRRMVCDYFEHHDWPSIFVLRGLTGVGKTRILQRLEQQGYPVVDLEKLANHRGSAFGSLGLGGQPGQKEFEARLWNRLNELQDSTYLITEGESRHIGRVAVPLYFHRAMQMQTSLWLTTSLKLRTEVILADYPDLRQLQTPITRALDSLKERLGSTAVAGLQQLHHNEDWQALIKELMLKYYDPLYLHTKPQNYLEICYDSVEQGTAEVISALACLVKNTCQQL